MYFCLHLAPAYHPGRVETSSLAPLWHLELEAFRCIERLVLAVVFTEPVAGFAACFESAASGWISWFSLVLDSLVVSSARACSRRDYCWASFPVDSEEGSTIQDGALRLKCHSAPCMELDKLAQVPAHSAATRNTSTTAFDLVSHP